MDDSLLASFDMDSVIASHYAKKSKPTHVANQNPQPVPQTPTQRTVNQQFSVPGTSSSSSNYSSTLQPSTATPSSTAYMNPWSVDAFKHSTQVHKARREGLPPPPPPAGILRPPLTITNPAPLKQNPQITPWNRNSSTSSSLFAPPKSSSYQSSFASSSSSSSSSSSQSPSAQYSAMKSNNGTFSNSSSSQKPFYPSSGVANHYHLSLELLDHSDHDFCFLLCLFKGPSPKQQQQQQQQQQQPISPYQQNNRWSNNKGKQRTIQQPPINPQFLSSNPGAEALMKSVLTSIIPTPTPYSTKHKVGWTLPIAAYKSLLLSVSKVGIELVTPGEPLLRMYGLSKGPSVYQPNPNLDTLDEDLIERLPPKLHQSLMPFQVNGILFGIQQEGRVLIGDEMGLGKTLQGLALCAFYKQDWPVLVACPSSLRFVWQEAVIEWLGEIISPQDIKVIATGKDNPTGLINIVSYGLLSKTLDKKTNRPINVVICDECHFLKNSRAQRTKAALPFLKRSKRVILLSGSPAVNRPVELFTQVHALRPKLFPNFHEFARRYCDAYVDAMGFYDTSGCSNSLELAHLLRKAIMIRRLKKDVLTQLKPKTRQRFLVKLSKADAKKIEALQAALDNVDLDRPSQWAGKSSVTKMYQATGKAKIPAVKEYVTDLIEASNTTKFLVFAHHLEMLDALEQLCVSKKVKYIRICGKTAQPKRGPLVHRFQNDPSVRVAVLSIKAAGQGLTLTAASTVIMAEMAWEPGQLLQCEDRCHRIGQLSPVNIQYIIAASTLDERIWNTLVSKQTVLDSIIGQGDMLATSGSKNIIARDTKQPSIMSSLASIFDSSIDGDGNMGDVDLDHLTSTSQPGTVAGLFAAQKHKQDKGKAKVTAPTSTSSSKPRPTTTTTSKPASRTLASPAPAPHVSLFRSNLVDDSDEDMAGVAPNDNDVVEIKQEPPASTPLGLKRLLTSSQPDAAQEENSPKRSRREFADVF